MHSLPKLKALEAAIQNAEAEALLSGAKPAAQSGASADSERAKAEASVQKLKASSARIERTKNLVAEMEETGADIIGTLGENREKMENISSKVKQASGEVNKADKITSRMGKFFANW